MEFSSFRLKEMETKKTIQNLSSNYFLVEASGDSDQLDFDHQDPFASFPSAVNGGDDDDDDDAESCSYDVSDYNSCVSNFHQFDDKFEAQEESSNSIHVNGKKEKGEEEEEVEMKIQERWEDSGNYKSCVSVESTNEPVNEMEKNRLFWETCLAS